MDFATFAGAVRRGEAPAPVTVFAGPEAFLRERGAAMIRETDPAFADGTVRLNASETRWAGVMDELHTAAFFGGRKLVVLVDEGNFVHNHKDEVRAYAEQPSPTALLAALVPTSRIPSLGKARIVECRSLKPSDLQRWIVAEAGSLGKSLDANAARLLASRAGGDLGTLRGHLEKLVLHAGARTSVTADDVRALVGNEEEHKVYELSLAAASKDAPRALRVLRALVRSGEAVQVLLWKLAWEYRKLAEAKKLLLAGRKRFEVTSMLQITYFTDEFLRLVDAHGLGELVEKHGEILKTDVALKTGGGEQAVLEALVVRLASDPRVGKEGRSASSW